MDSFSARLIFSILLLICLMHLSKCESQSNSKSKIVPLGPRPRGLFIQVSSIQSHIPYLDLWLDTICQLNSMLGPNNSINDIVLHEVAVDNFNGTYTMQWEALDIITKYMPGGSKQCFGNVFVGTIGLVYEEVQNPQSRQKYFNASKEVAEKFLARYSNLWVNWYIPPEAVLHDIGNDSHKAAWEELLVGSIKALTSLRQRSVMWSPSFWHNFTWVSPEIKSKLALNLKSLFTNVAQRAPPGVNWMNLQDAVGKWNPNCPTSATSIREPEAVQWYHFLKATHPFTSFQMNEELFTFTCVGFIGTSAMDQIKREKYYTDNGVRLGAAFELRYWRERLGEWDENILGIA